MTAYVNDEQKKEGAYGKAVKATLAATLAAGMVPAAAAFAEEPAEAAAENSDVELLANPNPGEAFSQAKVTAGIAVANDKIDGKLITNNAATAGTMTAESGRSKVYVPVTVQIAEGVNVTIVKNTTKDQKLVLEPDFKMSVYAADEDGNPVGEALTETISAGKYVTVIEAVSGEYKGGKVLLPYTIKPASLGTLTVFEGDNVNDNTFVYTGKPLELGVASDNKALVAGKDYEVTFKNAADNKAGDVVNAGTYYAEVKGLGVYAGEKATIAKFTVYGFNLANATITVDDVVASDAVPTHPTRVEFNGALLDPSQVTLTLDQGKVFLENGEYTFTATVAEDNANVTGSKSDVKVNKIGKAATFGYDEDAWKDSFVTDLSQKKPVYFDEDLIEIFNGKDAYKGDYKVEVFKSDDQLVSDPFDTDGRIVNPGDYTVKVTVLTGTDVNNFEVGGTATATVKVTNGAIDADATSWIYYDGKVVAGNELDAEYGSKTYTANGFKALVKNSKGEDVTSACTLKIVDQNGKEYSGKDQLKNAGTYTVTVESDAYEISNQTPVKFTISPFALDDVKLGAMVQKSNSGIFYVPLKADKSAYDVKALDVERFVAADDEYGDFKGNNDVKVTLEKWDVKNEKWDAVATAEGEGQFRLTIAPVNSTVAANYKFATEAGTVVDFRVVDKDKVVFVDVPLDAWYFETVAEAAGDDKQWIKGYNGTDFFGPNDAITRADVCVIMARMAGKGLAIDEEKPENSGDNQFFETPFADVDGNMYYAEAIAWAANTGIVKGDANTGAFRPTDQISRQEFAAMMARYAEKMGKDVSADASVLDDYADASSVAGWAKDYVAWAVEEGIMGQGTSVLWPAEDITRAAVATMLVRF